MLLWKGNSSTGTKGHRLKTPLHYAKTANIVSFLMKNLTNRMDPYSKTFNDNDMLHNDCRVGSEVQNSKYVSLHDSPDECTCNDSSIDIPRETESKEECNGRNTMFGTLLDRNDEAAEALLDEHIKFTGSNIKARGSLIVYDLTVFHQEASYPDLAADPQNFQTNNDFEAHLKMINTDSKAFEHPLSTAFVDLQSKCFKPFLPFILIRSFLLVLSLSALVMWQEHMIFGNYGVLHNDSSFENSTMAPKEDTGDLYWTHLRFRLAERDNLDTLPNGNVVMMVFYCLYALVCISGLLILHREFDEAYHNFEWYRKSYENILEICLIFCTTAYLVQMHFSGYISVKHASAWSVFFAWIEILIMFKRIPQFGTYIIMFVNVSKTLLGKFLLFIPGMIAFSFAFYVLPHVHNSPFDGIISSFIKSLVMMTGEIEFEENFELKKTKEAKSEGSAQILLLVFVVLFCIVLVNLLVGLAVSELQKELRLAKKLHNKVAVKEIDNFWKSSHQNICLTALKRLCSCFGRTFETSQKGCFLQKLIGPHGVFKTIRHEWYQTGLDDSKFSWKVCVAPNEGVYTEDSKRSNNTNHTVFFFDSRHDRRFLDRTQNRDKKTNAKKYHDTGLSLSHSIVEETINRLNEKEALLSSKPDLASEYLNYSTHWQDRDL